jgi:hypothetical protein
LHLASLRRPEWGRWRATQHEFRGPLSGIDGRPASKPKDTPSGRREAPCRVPIANGVCQRVPLEGCGGLVARLFGKSKAAWVIASLRDKLMYLRLRTRHIDICLYS